MEEELRRSKPSVEVLSMINNKNWLTSCLFPDSHKFHEKIIDLKIQETK